MIVGTGGSMLRLLTGWQRRNTIVFTLGAVVAVALHDVFDLSWLELPNLPLAVVGGALGIFVSFRTNSAYDRWWEGRKLWGRMINTSRHWTSQVVSYLPRSESGEISDHQRSLVMRHAAYVHALRCLLRQQDPYADEDFLAAVRDDVDGLRPESNLTHALLQKQLDEVTALNADGEIDAFRLSNLDLSIRHLLDIQGGCERIKKTPMPRIYSFIAERLVVYFSFLFPLTVVADLHWWVVPINLLVCMAFALISEAGRVLEDPFNMYYNGLPLSAISRMIEVNVRQRLGERREDLPELLKPTSGGILM